MKTENQCTRKGGRQDLRLLASLLVMWSALPALAQTSRPAGQPTYRSLSGPDTAPNRIESDRREADRLVRIDFMDAYYAWKEQINRDLGYSFGFSYVPAMAVSTDRLPGARRCASTAAIRHFGAWELLGRGTGTTGGLNYLVEYRHRNTHNDLAPFALGDLGYVGFIEVPFVNDQWHLTSLYWHQRWADGRFEAVAGFLDITDYVDVHPLTSPWTDFSNYAFSIGAATMDFGDDAALGLAVGGWVSKNLYVVGGFKDINSDPTDPFEGFHTFWNDHEYFKHVEIGWTTSPWDAWFLNNLHLTLWHADERDELGVEDGWGAVLSFNHAIGDRWLVFARGAFAEDGGSLLERSISIGGGYTPGGLESLGSGSQLGFGVNWGRPNSAVFGSGPDDQYTAEVYYRLQITRELAITPAVQLLVNPALNPEDDTMWVFGLRMRLAF